MHEIKCPHCGQTFTIDEAGYADIAKQVRDHEFVRQVHERPEPAERGNQAVLKLAEVKAAGELQTAIAEKDATAQQVNAETQLERQLEVRSLQDRHVVQIKDRDEQIERL